MAQTNRLADETSPYLRQHRENPVDWYPWGAEAFEAARRRDRPILLSVGYSACHWCHVMAHESFEDPATAQVMNELFVNVKVDREERPDVDAIYMEAVQAITGHGGWPMTVFLTPDGRPFFGGTYFPPEPRQGMPGFADLLRRIGDLWNTRREELLSQAGELTETIGRTAAIGPADTGVPGAEVLDQAVLELRHQYDAAYGGFGRAPKFPQTMSHEVLLRSYAHTGDDDTLHMVTNSLDAMASGGIYDHLGGGFSRYSVDGQWIVPHFEKMLYDNALLARLYLHAWQVTGKHRYLQVLTETIGYVLRDLRHADGGFYSAEDADSEGEEGKFYLWTLDQVRAVLGDDAAEFATWYGMSEAGNFEGRNILVRPVRGELVRSAGLELSRQRLFAARELRVRPGLDDKVLTEWNALMLSTLAEAAAATGNRQWRQAAIRNAEFCCANLRREDGRWLRSWQAGDGSTPARARHLAYAHDHAALVDAFVRLYETTGEARWVHEAVTTADAMLELFWDHERGGVFTTGTDAERLVTRPKDIMDDATPSANSTAALALLRLGTLTAVDRYTEHGVAILDLIGAVAGRHPTAFGHLLCALDLHLSGTTEVVVTGDRTDLVEAAQSRFLPNTVLAWGERFDSPIWEGRDASGDDGLAYVCHRYVCQAPVGDRDALLAQLTGT